MAPNNNASSMAVGTLQIRLTIHKISLFLLLFKTKLEYWFDFCLESFCFLIVFFEVEIQTLSPLRKFS